MGLMEEPTRREVRALLAYAEDDAGGLMSPRFARARPGMTVDEAETKLIRLTLEHTRNNKTRAAAILGISLKTLHNKLNRLRATGQPIAIGKD